MPLRFCLFVLAALLLANGHYASAQQGDASLTGPSKLGTFTLSQHNGGYLLRYDNLDLDFSLAELPGWPGAWRASRPDGSLAAYYQWEQPDRLLLLNGRIALEPGTGRPRAAESEALEQTWLFELAVVQAQQEGRHQVSAEALPSAIAIQYAELLDGSMRMGPKPLASVQLLRAELPPPFDLLGLPAYDEQPATWFKTLRKSETRKQEGSMPSGNFALVSPDLGLSMACSSGWVALVAAAYSPEEGYRYAGELPYGMAFRSAMDSVRNLLPDFWELFQEQGGAAGSTNLIFTTRLLHGLALILTRSDAGNTLMGVTLVYQPFMAGVNPPSMLPPVARESQPAYYALALYRNADLDWALWSDTSQAFRSLSPAGFVPVERSAQQHAPLCAGSALSPRDAMWSTGNCPAEASPVQALCTQRWALDLRRQLGEDYLLIETLWSRKGELLEPERNTEGQNLYASPARLAQVKRGEWTILHAEDAGLEPSGRRHAALCLLLDEQAAGTSPDGSDRGSFSGKTSLQLGLMVPRQR
jgi:hypothetical protein